MNERPPYLALFLLSTATLAFEINLSRLFSVQQFYHFAFMIVSIALLGFGASGAFLAIFPQVGRRRPEQALFWLSLGAGLSMLGAYLLINWLPFDSFSIAWDRRQMWILMLHYLALSAPFFCSGLAVGLLLSVYTGQANATYAANLLGSALGCLAALALASTLGGEGLVVFSSGLSALAALISLFAQTPPKPPVAAQRFRAWLAALLLAGALLGTGWRIERGESWKWLRLNLSPYKSLSYALQFPDAALLSQKWNAFSRVDLLRSAGVRSLPGLSYRYLQPLPPQDGLFVDGDELTPVVLPGYDPQVFDYTPSAIVYQLRPGAQTLILEPRGGLEVLAAVELGAGQVTAVESNPLNVQAARPIYEHPRVVYRSQSGRSYTRQAPAAFDLIVMPLTDSFHPVRSGAYSLAEDYRYTVESFQDALRSLKADGWLAVTRWLQTPPSESLRTFALAVTALERQGDDPAQQVVAFRSFNTSTVLLKNSPFTAAELAAIRQFCQQRAYDLVYAPDMTPAEANRFSVMPEPVYYQSFQALLNSQPRQAFYDAYPYQVSPPSDDHPFFGHYFKWAQTGQLLAEFGKTWQPFGGAGYFVILALLILASFLALALILLPAVLSAFQARKRPLNAGRSVQKAAMPSALILLYFALIGFGFLLVEIPLVQKFILFLGHPAYALTTVLFSILFFSGIGSALSHRWRTPVALGGLFLLLVASPALLQFTFQAALGLPLGWRLALTLLVLAPFGLLMGVAFPGGLYWASSQATQRPLTPHIWAVNGACSVVASILAALLALSVGFNWVLISGALCYLGACLIMLSTRRFLRRAARREGLSMAVGSNG